MTQSLPAVIFVLFEIMRGIAMPVVRREAPTARVSPEQSTDDCCKCPSYDPEVVLRNTVGMREALEREVPGKWFLIEGSLIASLRYGAAARRLKSGKLNLVDKDMDVVIITTLEKRDGLVQQLLGHMPGWSHEVKWNKTDSSTRLDKLWAPVAQLPDTTCAAGGNLGYWHHADLHILFEGPHGELSPDPHQTQLWNHWLIGSSVVQQGLIMPLRKARWGGGDAYVPNEYLHLLQFWNSGEYSKARTGAPMWKPLEQGLANGRSFKCPCTLDESDLAEIHACMSNLTAVGYEAFELEA